MNITRICSGYEIGSLVRRVINSSARSWLVKLWTLLVEFKCSLSCCRHRVELTSSLIVRLRV